MATPINSRYHHTETSQHITAASLRIAPHNKTQYKPINRTQSHYFNPKKKSKRAQKQFYRRKHRRPPIHDRPE